MMRFPFIAITAFLMASVAQAFFFPLTTEQRVAASSMIVVIKVKENQQDEELVFRPFSEVVVVSSLLGAKAGETIKVWDDIEVGENGEEHSIAGRDPYLEPGKTYFIYLKKNAKGRLVTVQSSLDCLMVTGGQVEKEDGEGTELLVQKVERIRKLLRKAAQAQKERNPVTPCDP